MTVLFCDISGFTTISEALEPQTLAKLMNEYLTAMTRVIHQHRGTIDYGRCHHGVLGRAAA